MCWQRHEQVLTDIDWHIKELDDDEARLLKTQQAMLVGEREVCFLRLLAPCLVLFESRVVGRRASTGTLSEARFEPMCFISMHAEAVVASLGAEWEVWLDFCSNCIAQNLAGPLTLA